MADYLDWIDKNVEKEKQSPIKVILAAREIAINSRDLNPEIKKPLDIRVVESVKKAAPEIQKYLESNTKKEHIVIGGSASAYVQVKGFRNPKDIDMHTFHMQKVAHRLYSILVSKYSGVKTEPIHHNPDGTKTITITINGKSAVDIKNTIPHKTNIEVFVNLGARDTDLLYRYYSQKPVHIGKLQFIPVSELLARKTQALNRYYVKNLQEGRAPHPRHVKDIADIKTITKSLIRANPNNPKVQKIKKDFNIFNNNVNTFDFGANMGWGNMDLGLNSYKNKPKKSKMSKLWEF